MDKRYRINGFSMIEMLIVLLIVSIFSFQIPLPNNSLEIFMNEMISNCISMQEKAFLAKRVTNIQINAYDAYFDENHFQYPSGIHCSTNEFHYNANGNISKACAIACTNGNEEKKIVFQLGSGRVRIDD